MPYWGNKQPGILQRMDDDPMYSLMLDLKFPFLPLHWLQEGWDLWEWLNIEILLAVVTRAPLLKSTPTEVASKALLIGHWVVSVIVFDFVAGSTWMKIIIDTLSTTYRFKNHDNEKCHNDHSNQ